MSDKNNNGKNSVPQTDVPRETLRMSQTGAAGDAMRLTVNFPLSFLPSPPHGFVFPIPISDRNFKAMFTQRNFESNGALVSFLEALTGRKISSADISISENEPAQEKEGQRGMSFDIHCKFTDGTVAEIEMECFEHDYDFGKRAEYSAARLLALHFNRGESWDKVPKAYQISVLNFDYNKGSKKALHHYVMYDAADKRKLSETLNIIFLELPKLPKPKVTQIKKLQDFEKWGIFLRDCGKENSGEEMEELARHNGGIKMAQAVMYKMSEETQRAFWQISRDKAQINYNTDMYYAEKRGEERGRAEGEKFGRMEGEKVGRMEGRMAEKIDTARNLIALGMGTLEQIAQATGLPLEEVREIAEN